jgi:uncharacterized protein YciI
MAQWIYYLIAPRTTFAADASDFESGKMREHFHYLQKLLSDGALILAGRTQDEPPLGICIFDAPDEAAARAVFDGDPAIKAGVVRGELHPYAVALTRDRES